jgi:3-isopropylmalate/(R)-2-methylmalate dehydratase large subunit
MSDQPRTLLDKIWDDHVVVQEAGSPAVLYIDLHLVHEVTSPQAFQKLRERGLSVRRPSRAVATVDHSIPTVPAGMAAADEMAVRQIDQLARNCAEMAVPLHGVGSPHRGIVHVIGPELGLTQPGMTIVCGDSHTATHGAFGALAFGIGTSEVGHVLATQCLLQRKPGAYRVLIDGALQPGVSAKDIILALIARIGTGGGTGYAFEYTGSTIRSLSMEERMTVCNMSIEAGARAGLIAPDETTFAYLKGRPHVPHGAEWEAAVERWRRLPTDEGASFDRTVELDGSAIEPMITYGTNPGMAIPVTGSVPDPATMADDDQRRATEKALAYMDLVPGRPLAGHPVDVVFIGSCTNGRLEDLRQAASLLERARRPVDERVRVLVVPGSEEVKRQAEAEGLDALFRSAGAEWREPGCSMCIAMNGDQLEPGQVSVSTSNRNFEGRQGKGGRTLLASPLTAAAAAITGVVTDPRTFL